MARKTDRRVPSQATDEERTLIKQLDRAARAAQRREPQRGTPHRKPTRRK